MQVERGGLSAGGTAPLERERGGQIAHEPKPVAML